MYNKIQTTTYKIFFFLFSIKKQFENRQLDIKKLFAYFSLKKKKKKHIRVLINLMK